MGQDESSVRANESVFRNADPANVAKSLLEGNRDHLLSQASVGLMKQGRQVGSLTICISELQQHAYAQRLELFDAQELRVDEFSVQKLRESHETIQRLTSHKYKNHRKG